MRDRGEQDRAQPLGLRQHPGLVDLLRQADALDRHCGLVEQRVEETAFVGGEQRPWSLPVEADDADAAEAGPDRQEQAFAPGKRFGASTGRAVVGPAPVCCGEVGSIELVLRRVANPHFQPTLLLQEQHHVELQHRGDLKRRRPEQIIQAGDAGDLPAEGIERLGGAGPQPDRDRLVAHPPREVARHQRRGKEEGKRHHVLGVGNGEGVQRRQEEEVVGEYAHEGSENGRPQAVAPRDQDHRHEEDQIDVLDADDGLERQAQQKRCCRCPERGRVRNPIEPAAGASCPHGRSRGLGSAAPILTDAAADMDVDAAGLAHQVLGHRAAEPVEPPGPGRGADDDLGDVVLAGEPQDLSSHVLPRNRHRLAAEALRQPLALGDAVALGLGQPLRPRGLDVERRPRRMQPIRHALGLANQRRPAHALADADDDALARRPRAPDRVQTHVREQLLVDPLGGAAERQFPQSREVAGGEVVLKGTFRHLRDVDLALLQPLDQVVRRDVDHLDVVGGIEDAVRHRLAHPDPGDPGDDVVQAFDVLDVESGVDVDPGSEDLLDVEVTLGMARAGRVGVREFVDEHQLRPAGEDGVEVHLRKQDAAVVELQRARSAPAPRAARRSPGGRGSRPDRRPRRRHRADAPAR